jgi:hypothetical protein
MVPMRTSCWRFLAGLLLAVGLSAQAERYELGVRLRAFERHLDAVTDETRRAAAYGELERAVQAFFRLDTAAVAKAIDAADCALAGKPWSAAKRYASSLQLVLSQRLVSAGAGELTGKLCVAYKLDDVADDDDFDLENCSLRLQFAGMQSPLVVALDDVPQEIVIPLADAAAGDHWLQWSIVRGDEVLVTRQQGLSVAVDVAPRLARLVAAAEQAETVIPDHRVEDLARFGQDAAGHAAPPIVRDGVAWCADACRSRATGSVAG